MNYENLIGITIDTNQVKIDSPIESLEEAEYIVSKMQLKYSDLEIILKCCLRRIDNINAYSAYTYHNPNGYTNYSLWDLINS